MTPSKENVERAREIVETVMQSTHWHTYPRFEKEMMEAIDKELQSAEERGYRRGMERAIKIVINVNHGKSSDFDEAIRTKLGSEK